MAYGLPGRCDVRVYVGYVRRKMSECAAGPLIDSRGDGYVLRHRERGFVVDGVL